MKLVCNYSSQLIELLDEKVVDVNLIKLGLFDMYKGCFEISELYRPLMIHGIGYGERAGMKDIEQIDWNEVNKIVNGYNVPHIGYHFIAHIDDFDEEATIDIIRDRMIENTRIWKEQIKVPFTIENIGYSNYYRDKGFLEYSVDPYFMKEVCDMLDIGIILDTSHAKVTASYYNIEPIEYIKKFPLDKLKEIHVNGTLDTPDGLRDKHLEMEEEDYKIVEWLVKNCHAEYLTLEYGGPGEHYAERSDKEALKRQLTRLMAIIN